MDLPSALPWLLARTYPATVDDTGARAQRVALQNAKLRVELQALRQELLPAEEVTRLGATLGQAIRKRVTRPHRLAPSLEGCKADLIQGRLRGQEEEVLAQLHSCGSGTALGGCVVTRFCHPTPAIQT